MGTVIILKTKKRLAHAVLHKISKDLTYVLKEYGYDSIVDDVIDDRMFIKATHCTI